MNSTLRYYWEQLRTSFWFVPAILNVAAIVLSLGMVALDHSVGNGARWALVWTYGGGPEGARAVLATIAGSMITVAGVVFSITIVALSLASAQFGPRLLRNFIRDRRNQVVLGTFTATFLYCLLVLRTVRGNDHEQFVPGISVTIGILLAVISLGVLTYFIHHVAVSIQAPAVIQNVTHELKETIDRLWPEELGEEAEDRDTEVPWEQTPTAIHATSSGYVDAIQDRGLIKLAKAQDLVIRLGKRPGHFVVEGTPLAWAGPKERMDDDICQEIRDQFLLVSQRTPFQDVEFAIDQLVEVAIRALSPGINDPFTAMSCLDRIGEALGRFANRSMPSPLRYDDEQRLRVIAYPVDFCAVADAAFNQIRQYGSGSAAVLIRMLETIEVVASIARRPGDRAALLNHAQLVHRAAKRNLVEERDLKDLEDRYRRIEKLS